MKSVLTFGGCSNQFDQDQRSFVDPERMDPSNRVRGEFQKDTLESHKHDIVDPKHTHNYSVPGGEGSSGQRGSTQGLLPEQTESKATGIIIQAYGDVETRPKNVAIFYYIRIN